MRKNALIAMYPNAVDEVYGPELVARIARQARLLHPPLSAEELLRRDDLLAQADVLFSGWGMPTADAAFLEKAPRLQAIFYAAGTIRGWAAEAVWERDLIISTAAHANAIAVAEYTVATALFSLKGGWRYAIGSKLAPAFPTIGYAPGAYRRAVGLIALGAVARLVIPRLRAVAPDLDILAYDPFASAAEARALGVELVELERIFAACDAISLHAPLLPATRGLIGRSLFESMRPGATFINTARGAIVREAEMIEVLARRPDLHAVLDVTDPEPPAADSPLFTLPNVVLTPHIAGSQGLERRRLGTAMVDEYERWISGQPLQWRIERNQSLLLA